MEGLRLTLRDISPCRLWQTLRRWWAKFRENVKAAQSRKGDESQVCRAEAKLHSKEGC